MHDLPLAMRVWTVLRAVKFQWTILDVLEQPEALLDDVMTLELGQSLIEAEARNANG